LVKPSAPARESTSSQVSQVFQGVWPPAQLVRVPCDADPFGDPTTVAVDLDDRAAARRARVVGQPAQVGHGEIGAERLADLVVVDQHGAARGPGERPGAVVVPRGRLTRLQLRDPGARDDRVAEAARQRQTLRGVGHQRPVPDLRHTGVGRGLRRQQHLGAPDQGDADTGRRHALEEVPPRKSCRHTGDQRASAHLPG
jgi:hypothetical protein